MVKVKFLKLTLLKVVMFAALALNAQAKEISFNEGTNFGAELSPDGTKFAMDLQGVLWTMPAEGGKATAITTGQQPEVREPSWSPDGTKIAFQGFYEGYFHIWTINADGSGLKQITSGRFDDREPSWNADGNSIVFASDRDGTYDIWEINLRNNDLAKLTTDGDDDGNPHKSADGERLLLTREIRGRYSEIVMIDYADDQRKEVSLMKSENLDFFRPTWHPDNEGFTYISHNDNEIKLNYVTDVYDRAAAVNAITLDEGDLFPFRPTWGEEGIYFTGDGHIKYRKVVKETVRRKLRVDLGKDIQTIPFEGTITAAENNYTRKTYNFDEKNSQAVRGVGSMDISADDGRMVFTALGDMWLQDGNGFAENIDDAPGHIVDPTWSRDGTKIAFTAERNGQMDIWIRDMETGEERQMTNDRNREYRISWSWDGSKLAFLSTRDKSNTWGRGDLRVMDVRYGTTDTLDHTLFTAGRPVWTLDGEHVILAFVKPATSRFREGMHGIKQYHVESHRSKFIDMPDNIGLSTRDGSGPVISPDGKKMVYIAEGEIRTAYVSRSGEITGMMDNRCTDTALMPRWAGDNATVYYVSGKTLKSCNVMDGQKAEHRFNVTFARKVADDKTIHVEKFFDGVSQTYRENVDVFITDNRITKIAPHGQDPVKGTFYDYSKKTMIPGIMAGHTHQSELMGEKLGRNWLAYGITSIRDPGTNPYKSLERKETWTTAKSAGPRMFYAGWLTGGARVYYGQSYNALNEKALRHELFRAKELDYDLLKSYVRLPDEFQQILVEEGHKMGIPVTSHEISPAVQNGMDSVEHMGATSRRGYSPKYSTLSKSYGDVINIISESGLIITPTATLMTGFYNYYEQYPEFISDKRYRTFLDEMQRDGIAATLRSSRIVNQRRKNPNMLSSIKRLHDKGANITAGTDSPFIPYGIAQLFEIVMFVDAGLTPYEALRAGTINVAKMLGVEKDLGTLEVGKLADMVIVDGDPLNRISDIFKVVATIKDGHHYTILEMTTNKGENE